jgi:uncharacterized Zn finger protein
VLNKEWKILNPKHQILNNIPEVENAILKRLGDAPFSVGKVNLASLLSKVYEVASHEALQKASGELEEDAGSRNT